MLMVIYYIVGNFEGFLFLDNLKNITPVKIKLFEIKSCN